MLAPSGVSRDLLDACQKPAPAKLCCKIGQILDLEVEREADPAVGMKMEVAAFDAPELDVDDAGDEENGDGVFVTFLVPIDHDHEKMLADNSPSALTSPLGKPSS